MEPTSWIGVVGLVVSTLGGIVLAYITYLAKQTHTAVNAERTAMQRELKRLNKLVTALSQHAGQLEGAREKPKSEGTT